MLSGEAANGSGRGQSARRKGWIVDITRLIHTPASRSHSFSFEIDFKLSLCPFCFVPLRLAASLNVFAASSRSSKLVAFTTVTAVAIKSSLDVLRNQPAFLL